MCKNIPKPKLPYNPVHYTAIDHLIQILVMRKIALLLFALACTVFVKAQLAVDVTFTLSPGGSCTQVGDLTAHATGGVPNASGLPYDYTWYELVNNTSGTYDTIPFFAAAWCYHQQRFELEQILAAACCYYYRRFEITLLPPLAVITSGDEIKSLFS